MGKNKIYRHFTRLLFLIPAIIGLAFNYGDSVYFPFTLKRTTGDIFDYIATNGGFIELIPQFIIDFWGAFICWLISVAILIIYTYKTKFKTHQIKTNPTKHFTTKSIVFILSIAVCILFIRGGTQLKPLRIIHAGKYATSQNISLILNTPFTIIKTLNKTGVEHKNYFDNKTISKIYSPIHLSDTSLFNKKNVVILILESFSREHSGYLNRATEGYEGFTPFLDSLMQVGVYVDGFANGKRSIDGIPAVTTSLPTLMNNSYITSLYSGNKLYGMAELLKQQGYSTSFYHGGTNGTMGFDAFAEISGFQKYIGLNEYNNMGDYDGKWGIFDEPFLQFFAKELDKETAPFFTTLFTLSSHHPYTIPKQHKGKFKNGNLKIQKAIMYSDYSLRKFFDTAKKMDWYNNTLFVITADHTSEGFSKYYKNNHGQYRVPIIFFDPKGINTTFDHRGQQMDIEPTILDLLNYPDNYIAFGRSLIDTKEFFAIQYTTNSFQIEYK
ncbi:MAG: LTA synthase family protein, partial [Bacteroidota bacterium]|nr:LTA synthase family protein [Bacteroidota bacterium]